MEFALLYPSSSLLLLLLLLSFQGLCYTQGRSLHFHLEDPHRKVAGEGSAATATATAEALMIGSRPPRCEGKCAPCGRCEAVQVPVAPRVDRGKAAAAGRARPFRAAGDDDGDDGGGGGRVVVDEGYTDYKPLNWKCRCADRRALDP
ncbi:hypothetical protein ACP4OV_026691 [Aristida adscensionis]